MCLVKSDWSQNCVHQTTGSIWMWHNPIPLFRSVVTDARSVLYLWDICCLAPSFILSMWSHARVRRLFCLSLLISSQRTGASSKYNLLQTDIQVSCCYNYWSWLLLLVLAITYRTSNTDRIFITDIHWTFTHRFCFFNYFIYWYLMTIYYLRNALNVLLSLWISYCWFPLSACWPFPMCLLNHPCEVSIFECWCSHQKDQNFSEKCDLCG